MADSLGTILSKGWEDFKRNPVLIIPGIITNLLTYIILFVMIFALIDAFIPLTTLFGMDLAALDAYMNAMTVDNIHFGRFAIITLVMLIVFMLISVFLTAGLTGMAKEAVRANKTSLGDLWTYGKKYFLRMLGLYIVIFVALMIYAVVIGVVLGFLIGAAVDLSGSSMIASLGMILIILIALILGILFALIIYFAPYALVLDDLGVIDSLRKSYRLFMDNKAEVFIFVIALALINIIISIVISVISFVLALIPIVGIFLMAIIDIVVTAAVLGLFAVWAVRKYDALTGSRAAPQSSAPAYTEYSRIEHDIIDSEGSVVGEEVYEEKTTVWEEKRD